MPFAQSFQKLSQAKPFTESEAWFLFRLAAIAEACGWTLLITGLGLKRYVVHGNNDPVLISGQIHGTIFLIYIVAVAVLCTSLQWSKKRTIVAAMASVPPYGSLIFEQWAAYKRRNEALKSYRQLSVRALIVQGSTLLAMQPKETTDWYVPGGEVKANEEATQALQRVVQEQTGIAADIGRLQYIVQGVLAGVQYMELYFVVTNAVDFKLPKLTAGLSNIKDVDELRYVNPKLSPDLIPDFLRAQPVTTTVKQATAAVVFVRNT